ncbi:MAG: hypothetical protein GF370_01885 [Candidatus Nealsonbacteria bacterium]|nr:hypothetical protein [Candidatus Nealsonbacteria bacterium]
MNLKNLSMQDKNNIDFIGIGAQRCGTSWIYACLYEHPEICMPFKEIHFFSRKRNWQKGVDWYKSRFQSCPEDQLKGEFSTSYLYSRETAERIAKNYPHVKLIASLRNPVERAISNYRNDIMGNIIPKGMTFKEAISENKDYINQGFYFRQIQHYLNFFDREEVLILIYEDTKKDPATFIKKIYEFLEVDISFKPSMLKKIIGKSRTPQFIFIDRAIFHTASFLRRLGLHKLVWVGKKTGIPELIRRLNTEPEEDPVISGKERKELEASFAGEVEKLSDFLSRDLSEVWFDYKKYL